MFRITRTVWHIQNMDQSNNEGKLQWLASYSYFHFLLMKKLEWEHNKFLQKKNVKIFCLKICRVFSATENWKATQHFAIMGKWGNDELKSANFGQYSKFQLLQSVPIQTQNVSRSRRWNLLSSKASGTVGTRITKNSRSNGNVWRGR